MCCVEVLWEMKFGKSGSGSEDGEEVGKVWKRKRCGVGRVEVRGR